MNIFVMDGRSYCHNGYGGIQRYKTEIVKMLDQLMKESENFELHVCYPSHLAILISELRHVKLVPLEQRNRRFAVEIIPAYIRKVKGIFLDLGIAWCISKNGTVVLHDARLLSQKYDPIIKRLTERIKYQYDAFTAKYIVTVSEIQKIELQRYLWIKKSKVIVIGCGWDHILKIDEDETIFKRFPEIKKKNYYYAVGSQYPHKNYKWIVEIAKRNPKEQFVIAGKMINNTDIEKLNNLLYVGTVSDEENKSLLTHSYAFLHPTKYEGFGIPPMEGLACGTAVIATDLPVLHEIYGNTIHYIDPDNYEINLKKLLEEYVEPATNVLQKYTWQHAAKKWLNLLSSY